MTNELERRPGLTLRAGSSIPAEIPPASKDAGPSEAIPRSSPSAGPTIDTTTDDAEPVGPSPHGKPRLWRKRLLIAATIPALAYGGVRLSPLIATALNTVSTDDAYVNGHVTFLAARVPGQVSDVLVDDNMRVARGDVLVRLDPEPNQVQVAIKRSAVIAAEADLRAAESRVRGTLAALRGHRWKLQLAIENVDNQAALLRARVATLRSREATFERTRADLLRAQSTPASAR